MTRKKGIIFTLFLTLVLIFTSVAVYHYKTRTVLAKYKGIKLKKISEKVTDQDVENGINEVLKSYGRKVSRGAKKGDVISYMRTAATQNKKAVSELAGSYSSVILGDDDFVKGFDNKLVGMKRGETKTITYKLPTNYKESAYAGKEYQFKVKVTSVQKLPKLTESFAKNTLLYSGIKDMKTKLKKDLEKKKKESVKSQYKNNAWDYVLKNSKVRQYPEDEIKECENRLKKYYKSFAKNQGKFWSNFVKENFKTEKKFNQLIKKTAKRQVKERILIRMIAEKENISYTKNEYKKKATELAKNYGYSKLSEFEKNNSKETIKMFLLKDDVLTKLVNQAVIK